MFDMIDGLGASERMARTLKKAVSRTGIGLHTGRDVTLTLSPAPVGTGILFRRSDLLASSSPADQTADLERVTVRAEPGAVTATTLGTIIANRHQVTVSTIEHVMAALVGAGIDDVIATLDGPEVPIMDGSAAPFVAMIAEAGIRTHGGMPFGIVLDRQIEVVRGSSVLRATPLAPDELPRCVLDVTVIYDDPAIGTQSLSLDGSPAEVMAAVAEARTFCNLADVETMRSMGLALGGSFDNAIVVSDGKVLNEGGLRMEREFVAHKTLDMMGDLYLLGAPLFARIEAIRPGHTINTALAQAIATSGAARLVPAALPAAETSRARA